MRLRWALLGIIMLGTFLSVSNISSDSMWLDEGQSVFYATRSFTNLIGHVLHELQQPGYFILLRGWFSVFGVSDLSGKLLSAAFCPIIIILTYLLGKELFSEKVGISAAFFTAISPLLIEQYQQVRDYSLFAALCLASFYFMVLMMKTDYKKYRWHHAVCTTCALYTHDLATWSIICQNAWVIWRKRFSRKWLLQQVMVGFLFIPGAILFAIQFLTFYPRQTEAMGKLFHEGFWSTVWANITQVFGNAIMLVSVFILLATIIVLRIRKKMNMERKEEESLQLVLTWVFVPLILAICLSVIWALIHKRYLVFIVPGISILASYLIFKVFTKRNIAITAIFILAVSMAFSIADRFTQHWTPEWEEVAQFMHENAGPNDTIIIYPGWEYAIFTYYMTPACFLLPPEQGFPDITTCNFRNNIFFPDWDEGRLWDDLRIDSGRDGLRTNSGERFLTLGELAEKADWLILIKYSDDYPILDNATSYFKTKKDVTEARKFTSLIVYKLT